MPDPVRASEHFTNERVAWMWSDELPNGYRETAVARQYFYGHDRFPVILRGSREVRDATTNGRKYAAWEFAERAARMLKLTTSIDGDQCDNAIINAIADHCRKRWPLVRDPIRKLQTCNGVWTNGVFEYLPDPGTRDYAELYHIHSTLKNIRRLQLSIKRTEESQEPIKREPSWPPAIAL
jgi:hypothetical protein